MSSDGHRTGYLVFPSVHSICHRQRAKKYPSMARYVLGLLLLVGSLHIIAAIPAEKPDPEVTNATAQPTSEPAKQQPPVTADAATPEPTTSTTQQTTTEEPTPETTTEELETAPPRIVCTDPREIYNECGNVCDDRTCDNKRRSDVQCSKHCVEGCYCRSGYVRDRSHRCIPAYRCGKD